MLLFLFLALDLLLLSFFHPYHRGEGEDESSSIDSGAGTAVLEWRGEEGLVHWTVLLGWTSRGECRVGTQDDKTDTGALRRRRPRPLDSTPGMDAEESVGSGPGDQDKHSLLALQYL
jgi:hypothetical protein